MDDYANGKVNVWQKASMMPVCKGDNKYLEYIPFVRPKKAGIIEKLRYYKLINRLTIKQLAKEIGCNHEQLMDWISGKIRPSKRNLEMFEKSVAAL